MVCLKSIWILFRSSMLIGILLNSGILLEPCRSEEFVPPASEVDWTKLADEEKQTRSKLIEQLALDRRPSTILTMWLKEAEGKEEETNSDSEGTDSEAAKHTDAPALETDSAESAAQQLEEKTTAKSSSPEEVAAEKAKAEETNLRTKRLSAFLASFSKHVTLGKWESCGAMLRDRKEVAEEEAKAIYARMIEQLTAQQPLDFSRVYGLSQEARDFLQSMLMNQRNNPAVAYAEKNSIATGDIIAILRCSPAPLENDDVEKIANLLGSAFEAGNQVEDFVRALKQAGDALLSRPHAALLLSSAGYDQYTVDFLPGFEQGIEEKNVLVLNLLARYHLARFSEEGKEAEREKAWHATRSALQLEDAEKGGSQEALTRAIFLAPSIREEFGLAWLNESFSSSNPLQGQRILAALGTATAQRLAQAPFDAEDRSRHLKLQKAAVDCLISASDHAPSETSAAIRSQSIGILNLLARNWMQEAEVTLNHSDQNSMGGQMRRDRYGNIYYPNPDEMANTNAARPMMLGQINPVEVGQILLFSPSGRWMEALDTSLRPHLMMMLCKLWLKVKEETKAFPLIEALAATHPREARELAEEFLRVWTENHNPNAQSERTFSYMFMYGFEQRAESIPLTRSKQQRNIQELSQWVRRLSDLSLEGEIDEQLLVQAFSTCHSVAEVFDVDDIESIFGAWDDLKPATMASLVQQMRSNLASVWRDPRVQQDAKTKRRKADIEEEVQRGYVVARQVLQRALNRYPDQWQLLLADAALIHDENDYVSEIHPSAEFTSRRREAFELFARAAQTYVQIAPNLLERELTNEAFDLWFYAALGSSDLSAVSEKNRPAPEEIEKINKTLGDLPGALQSTHRDRFANALFTRMSGVNPACKFRYLEHGFRLLGDHPQAAEAKKVYDYYKDLVTEIQLAVRVDGPSIVGHTEPFGVYVDLRHTKEIERESGGFAKYLQNQNSGGFYYNYGRPTEDYRNKFTVAATETLQDQFEVLSITFNHADSTSSPTNQPGWRVTPYAYLLLKARGPAVDKIPSLKMDMDFLDTSGYVVLPIASSPLSIDAGQEPVSRPSPSQLQLVQVLDERQAQNGRLIVEAKALGQGLMPPLEKVLEFQQQEFELFESKDSGVSIIEFDRTAANTTITSERSWTLQFIPRSSSATSPELFLFPEPRLKTSDLRFQRYVDADLEDVAAEVKLTAGYQSNWHLWKTSVLAMATGLAVLAATLLLWVRRPAPAAAMQTASSLELTPFSLLGQLRTRLRQDAISNEQKEILRDDIELLERFYFSQDPSEAAPDLQAISHRWG